jgi:hypothetical protein
MEYSPSIHKNAEFFSRSIDTGSKHTAEGINTTAITPDFIISFN